MKYLLILAFLAVSAALRRQNRTQTQFNQSQSQFPRPEEFEARLHQSIQMTNALADPCQAQVLLKDFFWPTGFGSITNNLAASMILALSGHGSATIQTWQAGPANPDYTPQSIALCGTPGADTTGRRFYSEMWLRNFDNRLGLPVCGSCDMSFNAARDQVWHDNPKLKRLSEQSDELHALVRGWNHKVLTGFFACQAHTGMHIDQMLAGLALGVDYIGVHIRHGDKGSETDLLDSWSYADRARHLLAFSSSLLTATTQKIQQAVELYGIKTVFLASDDAATLQQLQSALPTVAVKMAMRVPDQQESMHVDPYHSQAVGAKNSNEVNLALLTDIVGLWRSKVFIGTGSSNLGRLVSALRSEEQLQHDISLDVPFDSIL